MDSCEPFNLRQRKSDTYPRVATLGGYGRHVPIVVSQPFAFWRGHYMQYLKNLSHRAILSLYATTGCEQQVENGIRIPVVCWPYETSTIAFILARTVSSIRLCWQCRLINARVHHMLECEPLGLLFLLFTGSLSRGRVIITIHAVERTHFSSVSKNIIGRIHRGLFRFAIKCVGSRVQFVVHSYQHRHQLLRILGIKTAIEVIPYPGPVPRSVKPKSLGSPIRVLFFGQVREDKGVFELLRDQSLSGFSLRIVGKILDHRIRKLNAGKNVTIEDGHIPDELIPHIFQSHDFLILPYTPTYSGGAGPLREALAFGVPVICSKIPLFEEIFSLNCLGLMYSNPDEIAPFLNKITEKEYGRISSNCINYARNNSWNAMRSRYHLLYARVMRQQ